MYQGGAKTESISNKKTAQNMQLQGASFLKDHAGCTRCRATTSRGEEMLTGEAFTADN